MPVLLHFAVFFLLNSLVNSRLQCYQCTYPPTDECRDYPTNFQLGTCASGEWCVTSTSREYGLVEVVRSCLLVGYPPINTDASGCVTTSGNPIKSCYCQGEACNGEPSGIPTDAASSLFISNITLLATTLFITYRYFNAKIMQ